MKLETIKFSRKCSGNFRKNIGLMLARMDFGNLPLKTERGDIYPVVKSEGDFKDTCTLGYYSFQPEGAASCARLIGRFNPYSTYEIVPGDAACGAKIGVMISWEKEIKAYAEIGNGEAELFLEYEGEKASFGTCEYKKGDSFLFTFHAGIYFEAYVKDAAFVKTVGKVDREDCICLSYEDVFTKATASLYVESSAPLTVASVLNYLDPGVMQADIKPVKYENGEVLVEDGKVYFTYSARFETRWMQQVASYKLSTCELKLEGALLYDTGNGRWADDVAISLIYDRNAKLWRFWMAAFSNGHRLAYGETKNDPRFGVNVLDVSPLPFTEDEYGFGGRQGDEDPDLYFDEKTGDWYLTICRADPAVKCYRYYLFKSKKPNEGFEFVAKSEDSLETTGGSFVKLDGKIVFVFGRAFGETAKYDVCEFPSMKKLGELQCDYNDGGFRGWGSVFEIPCGTRKRLLWATFDRTLGSTTFNWSYGNVYLYESETMKLK